jgi:regulation of enolase protein 1 (concanavalin A-like superfamily)
VRYIKLSYPAIALLIISIALGQSNERWIRTFGGGGYEVGLSIQETLDGGYIVAGKAENPGEELIADALLIKMDMIGNVLWARTYGGYEDDGAHSVCLTNDGGYILAGYTRSYGNGSYDVWLIKTDAGGDTLWTRTYGGGRSDEGNYVQQTSDGGFFVAGYTESFGVGGDAWIIRTDSKGDTLWTRTYGGPYSDKAYSAQITSDNRFAVIGGYIGNSGSVWLLLLNAEGDSVWTQRYPQGASTKGLSLQQTDDNGFIITGETILSTELKRDMLLIRTNATGQSLWTRTYGGQENDTGCFVEINTDGGFVISGYTESYGAGSYDAWLIRTNAIGDTLWTHTYGGSSLDNGTCVRVLSDGGYVFTGSTYSYDKGGGDLWLIRTDSLGLTVPLNTHNANASILPQKLHLHPAYPNPFNPATTLRYDLPHASEVSLIVYDLLGREVTRLMDGYRGPGYHQAQWDGHAKTGRSLPSGIYIARLVTLGYSKAIKMVLLK